ncbi:MAG: hypothetical protein J1F66_00485 [Clostridiales bacterium]|nr:hypothetical protein [Clostridiales bacterium]
MGKKRFRPLDELDEQVVRPNKSEVISKKIKYYCMLKYFNSLTKDGIDTLNADLADDTCVELQRIVYQEVLRVCVDNKGMCGAKLLEGILGSSYKTFFYGGRYIGKSPFLELLRERLNNFCVNGESVQLVDANEKFGNVCFSSEMINDGNIIGAFLRKMFPTTNQKTIYLVDNFDSFCRNKLRSKYSCEQVTRFRKVCFEFFLKSRNPIFIIAVETSLFECFDNGSGKLPVEYRSKIQDLNYAWPQLSEDEVLDIMLRSIRTYTRKHKNGKGCANQIYRCKKMKEECKCSLYFNGKKAHLTNNEFLKQVIDNSGNNPYWIFLPLSHSLNTSNNFCGIENKYCYDEMTLKKYYRNEEFSNAKSRERDIIDDYFETLSLYTDCHRNKDTIADIKKYIISVSSKMSEKEFDDSLLRIRTRAGGVGTSAFKRKTLKQFLLDSTIILKTRIIDKDIYEVHPFIKFIYSEVKTHE